MNIEQLLKDKGMKKAELARRLGVSPQGINQLFVNPRLSTLCKIAEILEMPVASVIDDKPRIAENEVAGTIICHGRIFQVSSQKDLDEMIAALYKDNGIRFLQRLLIDLLTTGVTDPADRIKNFLQYAMGDAWDSFWLDEAVPALMSGMDDNLTKE